MVFCILGLLGNVLSFVVMRKRQFAKSPVATSLCCLAVADSIILITHIDNFSRVQALFGIHLRSVSYVACSLLRWLFRTSSQFSTWLIIQISFERSVAICKPMTHKLIISKKSMLCTMLVLLGLTAVYNGVWVGITDGPCALEPPTNKLVKTMSLLASIVRLCLAVGVLPVLNTTSIIGLLLHKRRSQALGNANNAIPHYRMTVMLISVTVVHMILIFPFFPLYQYVKSFYEEVSRTKGLYDEIFMLLMQLNGGMNFYLYVVAGRNFRGALWELLKCKTM